MERGNEKALKIVEQQYANFIKEQDAWVFVDLPNTQGPFISTLRSF